MSERERDIPNDLVAETRRIWDEKAAFWDEQMGEGNAFARELIGPSVARLLAPRAGDLVLDIGCGNGVISRQIARLGARVIATDFSPRLLELAKARSADFGDQIDYRLLDATDEAALLALGEGRFEGIASSMAMMDMPAIDPLLRAGRRLLRRDGRFVFAIQHPAFNSNAVSLCAESTVLPDGREVERYSVRIFDYLDVPAGRATGMTDEPEPHWYFHRPLHELFGACFAAGFVIDGLEEPRFSGQGGAPRDALSWRNFDGIPPVLVVRIVPKVDGS